MTRHRWLAVGMLVALGVLAGGHFLAESPAQAQFPGQDPNMGIAWEHGPCTARIGTFAEVKVPKGYKFTGAAGARTFLEITQNTPTPRDLGVLCPSTWPGRSDWFLTFEWDAVGYVKDDEKDKIDANAIMQGMKSGQDADNRARQQKGWPTLEMVGWDQQPFYDPQTNHLTWSTRIRETGPQGLGLESINYNSRILGRNGVMSANLVIDPARLQMELPKYKDIVKGFAYIPGQKYSEFRTGDKVATYGLTALVAGGAAGLAAKSGWLAKFGKVIIAGIVAVVAGIGALFKKVLGRSA